MKKPILSEFEREAIRLDTTLGAIMRLHLAWFHLFRDLKRKVLRGLSVQTGHIKKGQDRKAKADELWKRMIYAKMDAHARYLDITSASYHLSSDYKMACDEIERLYNLELKKL